MHYHFADCFLLIGPDVTDHHQVIEIVQDHITKVTDSDVGRVAEARLHVLPPTLSIQVAHLVDHKFTGNYLFHLSHGSYDAELSDETRQEIVLGNFLPATTVAVGLPVFVIRGGQNETLDFAVQQAQLLGFDVREFDIKNTTVAVSE